jgi:hypothetical protein
VATIRADFDSYKYWYYSGHPYEVLVYCYKGGIYVGRIVFFKDELVEPNFSAPEPSIHYPISRFADVIGTLRYEKPLYLFLNLDNLIGLLATDDFEPTGEQE